MAANEARERGNALYRERKLAEAAEAYLEAIKLGPDDPAPLSNMSAVRFEMGRYAEAAEYAVKALALSAGEPIAKKERVNARLAKSYLYANDLDRAGKTATELGEANKELADAVSDAARLGRADNTVPTPAVWSRLFDRLPRFKPLLQDAPEYFPIGHDVATPLLEIETSGPSNNQDYAFLFCGSGDARHVFATIISASILAVTGGGPVKSLHITLLDLKVPALARTLIVFELAMQYIAHVSVDKSPNAGNVSTLTASYLYAGYVMPPLVHEVLQMTIGQVIGYLEKNEAPFPGFFIDDSTRTQALVHLRRWQSPLEGRFGCENVRKALADGLRQHRMRSAMNTGVDFVDPDRPGTPIEHKIFDKFNFILPPRRYMEKKEPEMVKVIDACLKTEPGSIAELERYIDANWKTNPTLFDHEWDAQRHAPLDTQFNRDLPTLNSDPFEVAKDMSNWLGGTGIVSEGESVTEVLSNVFAFLGRAMAGMQVTNTMTIEMIAGEMCDVLERLRYDALPTRKEPPMKSGANPLLFPQKYDCIHMSNIPDYIGGLMSTHLYAPPLLRNERSDLRFNVLSNPQLWNSHDHFAAEYLLFPDALIPRHFGVRRQAGQKMEFRGKFFMGVLYWIWEKVPPKRLRSQALLSRAKLEHGLYEHFLKLALPYPRPHVDRAPIVAPLNLTALMRLVLAMHQAGYQAHWLAGVFEALCSGKISTTARAPRMLVTDPASAILAHPPREMDITPWHAEITTILSLWRGLLPFGMAPPTGSLVLPSEIDEYAIKFGSFLTDKSRSMPNVALVFWNIKVCEPPKDLRKALLDDETAQSVRNGTALPVHVVTTFKFSTKEMEASLWLRRDVVEKMHEEEGWKAWIWRTDEWERETDGVDVRGGLVKTRSWLAD